MVPDLTIFVDLDLKTHTLVCFQVFLLRQSYLQPKLLMWAHVERETLQATCHGVRNNDTFAKTHQ